MKAGMIYDSVTNRFLVSDPEGIESRFSTRPGKSRSEPSLFRGRTGIDETPDHSVLYAGTQMGDVYAIDPVGMKVTHRYLAAEIGPNGFHAYSARILANGELALLGSQGGISSVDGYGSVAVWNPSNNAITVYGGSSPFCVMNIGAFTLTGDRSLMWWEASTAMAPLHSESGDRAADIRGRQSGVSVPRDPDARWNLFWCQTLARLTSTTLRLLRKRRPFLWRAAPLRRIDDRQPGFADVIHGRRQGRVYAYKHREREADGMDAEPDGQPTSGDLMSALEQCQPPGFRRHGAAGGSDGRRGGLSRHDRVADRYVGSELLNDYLVPATGPVAGGTAIEFEDVAPSAKMTAAYLGGNPASSLSAGSGSSTRRRRPDPRGQRIFMQ